jgi:hypothetical protein
MESGEWRMEDGGWRAENGERRMESGEWRMESGEWRMGDGGWGFNTKTLGNVRFNKDVKAREIQTKTQRHAHSTQRHRGTEAQKHKGKT